MRAQAVLTVVRDTAAIAIGSFGILHEELTGHVNTTALAVYAAFLGLPGTISLFMLSRGNSSARATPEPLPSSADQPS